MKVWLTRNNSDNHRIRSALASWLPESHILSLPVLELQPLVPAWPGNNPGRLIFLSRPAVMRARDEGLEAPAEARYYAVGPSTADEVSARFNVACSYPTPHNADALLEMLMAEPRGRGDSTWILKGEGGRDDLALRLRKAGFDAHGIDLYRRSPRNFTAHDLQALRGFAPDCIVIASAAQLKVVIDLLPAILPSSNRLPTLVLVAERLQEEARKLGYQGKTVVSSPFPDDMARTLRELSDVDPKTTLD